MRYQITAPVIRWLPTVDGQAPSVRTAMLPATSATRRAFGVLEAGGGPRLCRLLYLALLLLGAEAGAQQGPDAQLPGRGVLAGLGVRDAGDLGSTWVAVLGIRFPLAPRVSGGISASRASVDARDCPPTQGPLCPARGSLSGLDLDLAFYYGSGIVYPYGVVSLGAGHLSLPAADVRTTSFAYSSGLGLGARAGTRVWLFLEGRWRQESFGEYAAHGLLGVAGANLGF